MAWLVVPQPGQGVPGAKSVLVNGLLVQNIVGAPSPNRSFWSMAVEAQLYLAVPAAAADGPPLAAPSPWSPPSRSSWRRWGSSARTSPRLDTFVIQSPPDLAALFAVGILAAGIVGASAARRSWPWAWLALAAAAPVLATIWWQGSVWTLDHLFWVDLALGPAIACLLAASGHRPPGAAPAPARRAADAQPRPVVLQPVPDHAPDRGRRLREDRGRPGRARAFRPSSSRSPWSLPLTIVFARVFASVFETPFRRVHRPGRPPAAPSSGAGAGMSRTVWAWGRLVGPAVMLAVLVWRLGTGPFLDGVRTVDGARAGGGGGHRAC